MRRGRQAGVRSLASRPDASVVMSDFYNEQSDQHLIFEGAPGQSARAVTIQGPKMHMFTQEPVFDIRDYFGYPHCILASSRDGPRPGSSGIAKIPASATSGRVWQR